MRLDINTYHEIADSLLRNKSRSLLTGFGIFWGLFMLLVMLGAGDGVKGLLSDNFEGFASNAAIVVSSNTSVPYKGFKEGRYWSIKYKDMERLKKLIPEVDVVTPMISQWGQTAVYNSLSTSCNVTGLNADYTAIEAPRMKYGRFLNEVDVERGRKVCVIGKHIYNELFPDGGDPCGTFIQVGPVYYQIVGVNVASGNLNINGSTTQKVVIPSTVAQQLYNRGDNVDIICLTAKSGIKMTSLESRVRQVMGREHYFDPTDEPAMMFLDTEQLFNLIDTLFRGVDFLILLIGLGTLLAGAIGVSNIMMVTVKERTVEIGIRRAIGATPRDILSQIMLESVSLTLIAGMFGIMFSVLTLSVAEKIVAASGEFTPAFQIGFWLAVAAAALLAVLGVAAGLAPALRAMNIKPVDAMRDE
jgi:putative ABC transport system permease protein